MKVFVCLLAFALFACSSATLSSLLGGGQQQQQQQPKIVKIIHINGNGGGGGHGHGHGHGDGGHSVIHLLVPTGDSGHGGWAAPSSSNDGWQSSGGWQSGGDGWSNGWD